MVTIPAYKPVVRASAGPYQAAALVGTHSVSIGWDVDDAHRAGLHGFAVRRSDIDPATGEVVAVNWLRGEKRFKDDPVDGFDVSSRRAPFQRFRWNDYALKPGMGYRFDIVPLRGAPLALTDTEAPVALKFRTSAAVENGVGTYVNRGVTSAFAYMDRFGGAHPKDVLDGSAYRWLSRGLKEALIAFIAEAATGEGLRLAIYEFEDADVAAALAAARARGVDVRIVYHAKAGDGATAENEHMLHAHGLDAVAKARAAIDKISHNKFLVHLDGSGAPVRLFTGTCNFSENAFYFQTNAALSLVDPVAAAAWFDYWLILNDDPPRGPSKTDPAEVRNRVAALMARINAAPHPLLTRTFFSPLRALDMLDAAVALTAGAKKLVLTSAPFGLDKAIIDAIGAQDPAILHYGLANTTARKKVEGLTTRNTRFFTPSRLETWRGRAWDAKAFGAHKIHTKLMIVDPFGASPQMLFGSANFSDESCQGNDENAFLTNDPRMCAVMATEFLRMFDHYKSRGFINQMRTTGPTAADFLSEDGSWMRTSFDPNANSHKYRDRLVFAGK